jgi:hypothetical protein
MTLPVNFSTTRVFGTFVNPNGSAAKGTVTFTPNLNKPLRSAATSTVVTPTAIQATIDEDGLLDVDVPSTDDPDITPTGWTYQVTVRVTNLFRQFDMSVPAGADIDLTANAALYV